MKRFVILLLLLAATAANCPSVRASTPAPGTERKKVGLVLSGGGAKGVAHIGVLKVLEEAEIPIDYIAGTSMGAIVGGLYSIGYTTQELDSLVRNQDWLALLSDRVERDDKLLAEKEVTDTYLISLGMSLDQRFTLPSGVVSGQNVLNLLNEMTLGYHDDDINFDSLPIPFACVTYDMVRGEQVVFRKGNLPTAIRASMSIPGAFAPVVLDSLVLVDGGIYNNFPVDIVREMGAEIIIGVDLFGGPHDAEGVNTIMGIIDQITTFLGRNQYNLNCENIDLHIRPDIKPYTAASFNPEAIDTLLSRGETAARERWDDIMLVKEKLCMDEFCEINPPRKRLSDTDMVMVGAIQFTGLTKNEENLIRPTLRIAEHSPITKGELNNAISRLRGSGAFSYVTYRLDSKPPYDMIISVDEKKDASVNVGFRFDSEEMASILLNTTLNFRGLQGPKLGITVRLNENPYVKLDFNSSRGVLGRVGVSYMFKSNNYRLYSGGRRVSSVTFGQNRVDLFYLVANPRRFIITAGTRYEHFNYSPFLFSPERIESASDFLEVEPEGFLNYYITTRMETFNNRYYPTKGMSFNTDLMLHTDNGYGYESGAPFASVYYSFTTAASITNRITLIPSLYGRTVIGNNIAYSYLNYMGGELPGRYMDQQLPFVGINRIEAFGRSLMAASLELRQRLFVRHFISLKAAYAIHDNDFFGMFDNINDVWGLGLEYSYNSPIGPISIQFNTSSLSKTLGVYFSLGKNF